MGAKKKRENAPMQIEFVCQKCSKHLGWALPNATMSCPQCGKWVNAKNGKKDNLALLPLDSDQLVLF